MKSVPHYGWAICLATTLLLFVTMGTVCNGFSIFLPYLLQEYSFTNTQTSSLVTLRCLSNFGSLFLIGLYYERFSIRTGTFLAALCAATAYLLYGTAQTYPLFCVGAVISGFSSGLGSMVPAAIVINHWFVKRRALALGICGAGSGIATIVLPPVTTALVGAFGVKLAFLIECAAIVAVSVIVLLIMRDRPSDMGLLPYGGASREASSREETRCEDASSSRNPEEEAVVESTAGEERAPNDKAMAKSVWVCMLAVCLIMGTVANPGFMHLPVLYTTEGFDPAAAAFIMSSLGITLTIAKLLYGETSDLLGGRRASLLFGSVLLVGNLLCCLAFTGSVVLCAATVLFLGVGLPISTVGLAVWAGDLARPCDYEKTVRFFQIAYASGALLFASVPGIIADHAGSYIPAYALFSLLILTALVALTLAYRLSRKTRG